MNGRVQDAAIGRFLSPDPYVPDSANTQSFDRYTYVLNNPLSFTDPTGFQDTRLPVMQQPISDGHNAPGGGSSQFVPDPNGGGWLIPDELFVTDTSPYGYVDSAIPTVGVDAGRLGSSQGNGSRRSGSQGNTQSDKEKSKQQEEKPKKPEVSRACKLAEETQSGDSLLDNLGTGLSGMDASAGALSTLATQAPRDIAAAVSYFAESASRFALPLGTGFGVVKAGDSFIQGDISGGIYSSVDVTVNLVLAGGGPVGAGVAFAFDAIGGSKAVVHFAAGAVC